MKPKKQKKPKEKCIVGSWALGLILIIVSLLGFLAGWALSLFVGFTKAILLLNTLILFYLLAKVNRIKNDLLKITFKK